MGSSTEIRLLTATARKKRPYPRLVALILGGAVVLSIVTGGASLWVHGFTIVMAVLCGAGLAHWLETRAHDALVGRPAILRLMVAMLMPGAGILLAGLAGGTLGLVGAVVGDRGALFAAGVSSGLWMMSAALGTLIVVAIDILISAAIPDFRSRIQLAVFGLLSLVTVLAAGVAIAGDRLADLLKTKVFPEIMERMTEGGADLGDAPLTAVQIETFLTNPDTASLIAGAFVVGAVLFCVPALLSACGKLADLTMERLHPLRAAFKQITEGNLEVRVEEAGSRDFVEINRGFNRMAEAQGAAFEEIKALNLNLEGQVEARTRELKKALDELTQAQSHLVESEKQAMLGRLFAGILHEVNTPLGALRSAAGTVGRSMTHFEAYLARQSSEDPDAKRLLRTAAANLELARVLDVSSGRLEELMTSFSRFVGLDSAQYRRLDVREGIESALRLLSTKREEGEGLTVELKLAEDLPPVMGDPGKLNRAFFNLIDNALTALKGQPGGTLQIGAHADGQSVTIDFEDNGPGIEPERQKTLFDFGFTEKDSGRIGLRLGLPFAKRWVEEAEGRLSVDSVVGRGTSVRVRLPICSKGVASSPVTDGRAPG